MQRRKKQYFQRIFVSVNDGWKWYFISLIKTTQRLQSSTK